MYYDPQWATFKAGTRVRLIRQRKYPEYKLVDLIGTVSADSSTNVPVVFDDVRNTRSLYGCFYFKPVDLVEVDDNDNIMEEKNMYPITNYLNVVKIKALNDTSSNPRIYEYANFEPELSVGDLCVVTGVTKTSSLTDMNLRGLSVATVVDIEPRNDINIVEVTGEVVAKLDTDAYNERVRRRIKIVELKSKMEARAKQLQDIALYKMLADNDSDMKELLREYEDLSHM